MRLHWILSPYVLPHTSWGPCLQEWGQWGQASPSSPFLLLSGTFVSRETKVQRVCPSLFGMASHTKQDIQWGQEERKQPAEKGGLLWKRK